MKCLSEGHNDYHSGASPSIELESFCSAVRCFSSELTAGQSADDYEEAILPEALLSIFKGKRFEFFVHLLVEVVAQKEGPKPEESVHFL